MSAGRAVLASASPRRQELLAALLPSFEILPAGVDESLPGGLAPEDMVTLLAERKAAGVAALQHDSVVIAADTLVFIGAEPLRKPAGPAEATAFLRRLRDCPHRVLTGICVQRADSSATAVVSTIVTMRKYSDGEIHAWVESGAAFDKAGAYAIQDAVFHPVMEWQGCYCNVVGLPLWDLRELLRRVGPELCPSPPFPALPVCAACPRR